MKKQTFKAEFTHFGFDSNWVNGKVGIYTFEAKLFDYGSEYGINNGRVSKLSIYIPENENYTLDAKGFKTFFDRCLVNYDRGWDKKPSKEIKPYFEAVMLLCESSPARFELHESFN